MANSAEAIVYGALKLLAGGRIYPDVAPQLVVRPYVTYQAVGGQSTNYMSDTDNLQNARIQVNAWADDRKTAIDLIQGAIAALTGEPIYATNIGAPVSTYEPDTKLYGSRLDFSIWFNP
ncbi:DUF3168 domain-containing protein [Burkholderia vietnamiensis]|uniref:DUF3168 domain-containing protein n=1 Tax=Burkholderia vietnamiensis TaxID=60552 RepID=UPI001BA29379|nr:DUF3168 domain-containing protein [Burkholderia vietnamiensis]MBR8084560.1 DUF3168 domain-containing protein [Burkholderia vietnamiensis]MCA8198346.1 DUF3168 domain-containing protein [Burkholderia vietnamiensis]